MDRDNNLRKNSGDIYKKLPVIQIDKVVKEGTSDPKNEQSATDTYKPNKPYKRIETIKILSKNVQKK